MNDVKVPFSMSEFSISNIIEHHFHVDNDKGKSGTGYLMLIGHDLMAQLGLSTYFKHRFLQWDGAKVPMKNQVV